MVPSRFNSAISTFLRIHLTDLACLRNRQTANPYVECRLRFSCAAVRASKHSACDMTDDAVFRSLDCYTHHTILHRVSRTFPLYRNFGTTTVQYHKKKKLEESIESDGRKEELSSKEGGKPPSYWQRFKEMYKKYWYVLIPVHAVTSLGWMAIFYYLVRSGFDIVPLLEKVGASEKILVTVRKSGTAAYLATAYAIYHLVSPVRYAVTLGVTTFAISYLKRRGYIKPVPSKDQMKKMIKSGQQVMSRRFTRRKNGLPGGASIRSPQSSPGATISSPRSKKDNS